MRGITPRFIRNLPVHAASGLVIYQGKFFIASDDEVHLVTGTREGAFSAYALWDAILPEEAKARKKVKPDFETLFLDGHSLHILPSFSRPNRTTGAVVHLDPRGEILSHDVVSYEGLYQRLSALVPDINIEGAVIHHGKLHLFQRGNGENGQNAVIVLDDLASGNIQVKPLQIPAFRDGWKFTVTDATLRDDKIWFLAVAEATTSTYEDGKILGSAIGNFDKDFRVGAFTHLNFESKPEGLACDDEGSWWIVTDDDSREKPSRLFRHGF